MGRRMKKDPSVPVLPKTVNRDMSNMVLVLGGMALVILWYLQSSKS